MTPLVRRGDPIAVVAPCGIHDPARLERGIAIARERGHELVLFPEAQKPWRYLAAEDAHRAAQLQEALSSPDWAAVWATRGGYGVTRILGRLDPSRMLPKPMLGFSDLTALFSALHPRAPTRLVHAPVVHSLPITDAASLDHLFALLDGAPMAALEGEEWAPGEASGWLCGGNLAMFGALCGTPWQARAAGAIVVLEEIGEAPYRIDRLLQQLVQSGFFDGVVGIGVGQLEGCDPPAGATFTPRDVFVDVLGPLGLPIVGNLPVGHGAANRAFVWGERARLGGGAITVG